MAQERMSVWQSPSGNLHWLRGCSGAGGRHRVRRVAVSRDRLAEAAGTGQVCRCLRNVEFAPGKRARN